MSYRTSFESLDNLTATGANIRDIALCAVETGRVPLEEGRKLIAAQALETSVQSAITDYLDAQRIPYARTDATESFNRKGQRVCRVRAAWPDLTICGPGGVLVGCEVKRAVGGVLSFEQADMLHRIHLAAGLVVVARSVDAVMDVLRTKRTSQATIDEIVAALKKGPKTKRSRR